MSRLAELSIPFVRRRSGGGTVYHDLGNTNYCLMSPRAPFQRRTGVDMITRALRKLKIPAYVNERHDICVEQFKVSGSAFKIGNARAYHHGTMLIDAQLHDLRGVLRNTRVRTESRALMSRSLRPHRLACKRKASNPSLRLFAISKNGALSSITSPSAKVSLRNSRGTTLRRADRHRCAFTISQPRPVVETKHSSSRKTIC